ncbi:MAG: hypothetical protein LUD02_11335 [Tannerellaceae bacterium]|nr:hypothetical protein [Tannerellaceae bacterium]
MDVAILEDLQNSTWLPSGKEYVSLFKFKYTAFLQGEVDYITFIIPEGSVAAVPSTTITDTFTSDGYGPAATHLVTDELSYNFTITETSEANVNCVLTFDLTAGYQQLYPAETINRVTVTYEGTWTVENMRW